MKNISQQELGYVVGIFIGDGYAHYDKCNRHHNVDFYLNSIKDGQIIERLFSILTKSGLNVTKRKDKRYNSIRVRVSSKSFMGFMNSKESELSNGGAVQNMSEDYKIGVISGFIDAEGFVGNGEIQLTQRKRETLLIIKGFCDDLGILTRKFWSAKNYRTTNLIWRLRISTKFKYAPHNSYKVQRAYGLNPNQSAVEQLATKSPAMECSSGS